MINWQIEKCGLCKNGKIGEWNAELAKWELSEKICRYCGGTGFRRFYIVISGRNFLPQKFYETL